MSIMQRLLRAFETASNVELSEKDRGGMWGEQYAEDIIDDEQNGFYIRNPIIPHPRKPGIFFETDFLVYMYGTLYCVEIKNYRGKVYYPARYRTVPVQKGWFIFKWTVQKSVFLNYDYSKIVQEKFGHNGEGIVTREMPNPLEKTERYIEDLQRYLDRLEPRLHSLPIYPIVGFAEKTDISAIYDFDKGIVHISELPAFFEKHGKRTANQKPAPWMRQAFQRLPTWDKVFTTGGDWINGTLVDPNIDFKSTDGRTHSIPYARIQIITLQRSAGLSSYDELTITYLDGKSQSVKCASGEIRLNRFQGEQQIHKLRNINKIVVGIANKK